MKARVGECSLQCIQRIGCRRCTAHRVFSRKYTESHYSIRSTVVPANRASTPSCPILAVMARQPLSKRYPHRPFCYGHYQLFPLNFPKKRRKQITAIAKANGPLGEIRDCLGSPRGGSVYHRASTPRYLTIAIIQPQPSPSSHSQYRGFSRRARKQRCQT